MSRGQKPETSDGEAQEKRATGLTILIADDHPRVRYWLKMFMKKDTPHRIVAEAGTGKDAVELALMERPDLVVMDADMPDMDGIEATRRILARLPATKVLAISCHGEEYWIYGMLKAGALGFVFKEDMEVLRDAIDTVAAGKRYLSQRILDTLIDDYVQRRKVLDVSRLTALTDREREVLRLIGLGCCTKDIADQLHLSTKTVDKHRREIMERLDLKTSAALISFAIQAGLAVQVVQPPAAVPGDQPS